MTPKALLEDKCSSCFFGYGENPEIVNYHDAHYKGSVQPIELMQAQMSPDEFIGFLKGNIIKYACRIGKKDEPGNEADKIIRYAEWLKRALMGETINPKI